MGLFRRHTPQESFVAPSASSDVASVAGGGVGSAGDGETFAMVIQDIFSITGRGTVVTGVVATGQVAVGDVVTMRGPGREVGTVIGDIEMFRRRLSAARAGDHVGLLLRGVDRSQVQRGDVIQAAPRT